MEFGSGNGLKEERQRRIGRVGRVGRVGSGRCNGMSAISCEGRRGISDRSCGERVVIPGDHLAATGRHDWRWCQYRSRCGCGCGANDTQQNGEKNALENATTNCQSSQSNKGGQSSRDAL